VPDTLDAILKEQPRYLNGFFDVYLATSSGKSISLVEEREGIKINLVPMVRGINPLFDIYSIIKMILLIIKIQPDIIHSYTPKAGLVTMISAWLMRTPVRIHTFTGLIFPTARGLKKRILIAVDRLICHCATVVVPEGEGVKNDLYDYKITDKPLDVIGYGNIAGVDTSFFEKNLVLIQPIHDDLRKAIHENDKSFVFCFVGRLNKDKGVAELVKAFSLMPENAILFILGNLDSQSPPSKDIVEYIESHPRIYRFGFREDIRPFLARTHILVLPSYREGFPNVILQANSMEVPAIVTNINGCNEVIQDQLNGWLVKPGDYISLYIAMEGSMACKKLSKMGDLARNNIVTKYERNEHWIRMVDFYGKQVAPNEKIV
ncbi:glycosyltransferase, partial [Vibrio sp. V43_P6S15P86]|uniref:glycosyltransferase n=1 Tax=Vibrio sp. V43_P6S15P86 TaxID=1938694 RepID=UPI001372CF05